MTAESHILPSAQHLTSVQPYQRDAINPHAYKLEVPGRIQPVFHVDLLRPVPDHPLPSQEMDHELAQPVLVDGQEMYRVECILDEKKARIRRRS